MTSLTHTVKQDLPLLADVRGQVARGVLLMTALQAALLAAATQRATENWVEELRANTRGPFRSQQTAGALKDASAVWQGHAGSRHRLRAHKESCSLHS